MGYGVAARAVALPVAIPREQEEGQERNDDDARADGADGLQVDGRNAHEHADDVGHEPR